MRDKGQTLAEAGRVYPLEGSGEKLILPLIGQIVDAFVASPGRSPRAASGIAKKLAKQHCVSTRTTIDFQDPTSETWTARDDSKACMIAAHELAM